MSKTINTHTIVGYLGADPELRTLPSGDAMTTLSVGTSEEWIDKSTGELKSLTEWHSVVLFRRSAENACTYLRKGALVYAEGRSRTRKYQDNSTGEDRYSRTLEARIIKYLDRANGDSQAGAEVASVHQAVHSNSNSEGTHEAWLTEFDSVDDARTERRV